MKGYHGTTPQNAQMILQAKEIKITPFTIKSDVVIPSGQRLPNDLGQGLYLFLDDELLGFDGKECAKKYAHRWRNQGNKISLIQFHFDETVLNILDLNNPENLRRIVELRSKLYQRIEQSLTTFQQNKSLKRANLDGIFIEFLVQHALSGQQVDGIIKDTFTPFYSEKQALSNVPNGRELCLRNVDAINWEATKEVK
ncbi:hypothetical protein JEQ21_04360 [Streptococcus sp. 121]|uniref:hypothetical protein n=1 Tax=Streptococcus sp. 121 TaxID=2797637 RepID=UPI0018F05D2D|nr:hypothetical protein [Streptococcus sp. 121]MBJ6745705.1 hypothetical protein [Streptococcus sp. 121]